nr:hypothetical protein [Kibdelosporangium sp. MJ126-NF4]
MRRQLPTRTPGLLPRRGDRLIDHVPRHRPGQHTDRNPVGQRTTRHHTIPCHNTRSSRPATPPHPTTRHHTMINLS